jgi:hypothetical protein
MEIFEWFAEASKLKDNDPKFTAVALTAAVPAGDFFRVS